jgi:hypothetical protein
VVGDPVDADGYHWRNLFSGGWIADAFLLLPTA